MSSNQCNKNFQSQYTFINGKEFSINKYLDTSSLHNEKKLCKKGHELILAQGQIVKPYFRHKNPTDVGGHPMTEWHCEWQGNFPNTEVEFKYNVNQLRDRRADVVLDDFKQILEIQHSKIESGEVNERNKDYALHQHTVKWIIDGQNCIDVKRFGERIILEFTSNHWLYKSFLECDYIYYDINGFIYRVKPKLIKSYQVDVSEPKLKSEFIEALKTNTNLWENEEPPQCFLYLKQKGAGSGKTYGMMQMLNSDREIVNYKYIAFITKQHSAVKVMLKEFDDQYDSNKLTNIVDLERSISKSGNQYIRKYKNVLTGKECIAIFGTVDSFTYSLGESSKNSGDKFDGIVKSIRDGTIKTSYKGAMKYASVDPILNKEMIIMIDETQDLTEAYGEAFLQIVRSKYTNLCVVGDRLQSLSYKENTLTYLHRAEDVMMKIIKCDNSNFVRRFSDPRLIKFVNDLIPFEKYGLPPMTSECEKISDDNPLIVFKATKTIYADTHEDSEEVIEAVQQIMDLFIKEVETNNRIPEDFLIVTPFTKKNPLVEALQIAINSYWKDIMENNKSYIDNVKSKNEYWKNIDTTKYIRYAIFHKSQDGCSINTNESLNATRMVSIHSSKGDGRKVVFVIGVTSSALQLFSEVSNNLIYDSLLHVAITRQKEKLYFRLEGNNDDIHNRIKKSDTDILVENTNFDILKKAVKMLTITDKIQNFSFEEFYKKIISMSEVPSLLPDTTNKKLIIDMGDHNIRYGSIFMNIIVHECNHEFTMKSNTKKQNFALLNQIKDAPIKDVNTWKEYYKLLEDNNKKEKKIIPVLEFKSKNINQEYQRYYKIITTSILRIREELECLGKSKISYFCPFESVILYYMKESTQKGKYLALTISDIYNIIDIYSKVFDSSAKGHEHCKCKEHFSNNKKFLSDIEKQYKEYLYNHFDRLEHVNNLLDTLDKRHNNINWLYSHHILIGNKDKSNFSINKEKEIIGYNDKTVFNIYIKPQLNDLNFNEFLVNSILDTFILSNLEKDSENFKKFGNKTIISYVISLNKDVIYEVNWSDIVDEKKDFIQNVLYEKLYDIFNSKHEQYYNVFINLVDNMGEQSPQKFIELCENKFKENPYCPSYLGNVWRNISDKIEECDTKKEKNDIFSKYKDKDVFIKLFDSKLKVSLKSFLDINDDE
jgi:hypothetical protein